MNTRIKKFLSFYKPYMGLFYADMACAIIVAAIALVFPLCTRTITKDILEAGLPNALNQIYLVGAFMLGLVVIQTACSYFYDYRGHAMGAMMETDMRSELFDHLQKLSFRFYDNQQTGQLMSRLTNDLLSLTELYHHGPEDLVIYSIKFIGAFIILLTINVQLTLVVFLFLPVMVLFTVYFNKKMKAALKRNKERIGDINAQVEDNLSGIRVVQSFANESLEKEKFRAINNLFLQSRKNGYQNEAYLYEGITTMSQFIIIAVVVLGGSGIVKASLDLADLLTFLLYIGFFIEPIQKMGHITSQYQEGFASFERFMEIMEMEPDIQDSPDAIELPRVVGNIEFQNVGFKYHEDLDYVLENISLHVKAGDSIAVVGFSGVGKTTLCSLIPRFHEVSEGNILLDGVNLKDIRLNFLRRNVGVVQQDVYLFTGTVMENIRYGKPDADKAQIIEAAKKANAHDFIMQLPQGYDTNIGQHGVKLSGGQKQRLSIARVFLKNPPILIFDEATSALDNESEKVIQESLELLSEGRTTFVIAHRLSTIRHARRIIVLNDHGIEQQGTHDELLARNGTYAHLYNAA